MEILNKAIDDRNMTSHTYNEELAIAICHNIESYYDLMSKIVAKTRE